MTAEQAPERSAGGADSRRRLVERVVRQWIAELIDLGGRNNLLNYRDLRAGTVSLDAADSDAMESLLGGRPVALSRLFASDDARKDAVRRARAIHRKARENFEERGVETLYLGCGLATWTHDRPWTPAAPVLLIPAELTPLGAAMDDFRLTAAGEPELNPTLLHLLRVEFRCDIDPEGVLGVVDGPIDEPWEVVAIQDWVSEQAGQVPGFVVRGRFVLANFSYAKLPMVRDLENATDQLVAHDLIAALAGDARAREAVHDSAPAEDTIPPVEPSPADEFLVLDADSTQIQAINAVIAGQHLIVRGPPGTGKSQSIANLVASLIARGKSVLFVAEKRAAIEAVLKRLRSTGLSDLVLDLHGVTTRKAFAQEIGRALYTSRSAPRVERAAEDRRLLQRRAELNENSEALHQVRAPWNVSFYGVLAELVARRDEPKYRTKLPASVLERLHGDHLDRAMDALDEYEALGGLEMAVSAAPWARSPIVTRGAAAQAFELLEQLRRSALPELVQVLEDGAADTGASEVRDLEQARSLVNTWESAARVASGYSTSVYQLSLDRLTAATRAAAGGFVRRSLALLFSSAYREARAALRAVTTRQMGDAELHALAVEALATHRRWTELGAGVPTFPDETASIAQQLQLVDDGLASLEEFVGRSFSEADFGQLASHLDHLYEDRERLAKLPELHRLRAELESFGLKQLLRELEGTAGRSPARRALKIVWLNAIFDQLVLSDPLLTKYGGDGLDAAVTEFQLLDRAHLAATADRIRRAAAEHATLVRDQFRDQAQLVQRQAALQRRHLPVRSLVHSASDVLLALKPCWAMSPLMVSQLLPPRTMFDVVVFDEASQVTPADAATSILRGRQLVVAGDDRQLPPTRFFAAESDADAEEEEEDLFDDDMARALAGTKGFESILGALDGLFPIRMLQWHYRSRDERLIAFSNAHLYDGLLTTFPGIGGGDTLEHIEVPWRPGADTNSPAAEVHAVVNLILEHAQNRPQESLGVIAMGVKHAVRIDEALRARLRNHPELDAFFTEDREEAFFVKNLERVQGDERDAIILTIGYGKNERGEMVYRFGPLLSDGGERRLNVAVTRAKRRLRLVTSFSAGDLDPERLTSRGMQLLRSYLEYVESGGANLGGRATDGPLLNPFEVDVRDTLLARGLDLVPQYGVSGYRIDFAVRHPYQPGEFAMAIECDGTTYHASETARDRDRLRQQQLETLGWRFHRIWSSEWFHDKDAAVAKVMAAYESALRGDPAPRAEEIVEFIVDEDEGESAPLTTGSRLPRPPVPRGWRIDEYWGHQLIELIDWIESDDLLRTEDEVIAEAMNELGFQRKGSRIVAVLRAAVRQARQQRKPRPRPSPKRTATKSSSPKPVLSSSAARTKAPTPAPAPRPATNEEPESPPPSRSGKPVEAPSAVLLPARPSSEPAPAARVEPRSADWGPNAERELAQVNAERDELERMRSRLPAGEYVSRLHAILARRRELSDARRRATSRVADGSIVTLEDPDGQRVSARLSSAIVIEATKDGWIQPGGIMREGISAQSDLGKALLGREIGETCAVDGVEYRIVDIDDR